MRVHKEHRIACSAEQFWQVTFDPEFARRMNLEAMQASQYEVLERSVEGPEWRMRSKMAPKDNMPGFIKKLVGDAFSTTETLSRASGSDRATSQIVPSVMRDKMSMRYELKVVPEGEGACRRIMDWEIDVKIFAIGGQVEKFAAGEIERAMDASARFLDQHAAGWKK